MPNTPYWVITSLAAGLTEKFSLQSTGSSAQAGIIGWDILDTIAASANSGQSWSISGGIPMVQVNASAVPEPSTWAASGALALMAGFAWRRRPKEGLRRSPSHGCRQNGKRNGVEAQWGRV